MNFAILKINRRRPENKIHMSRDITVLEILPIAIGHHRILPTHEPAILKYVTISIDIDSQCLTNRARAVLERDIVRQKIIPINKRACTFAGPQILPIRPFGVMRVIKRKNRPGRIVTEKFNERFFLGNSDYFVVCAGFDMDDASARVPCSGIESTAACTVLKSPARRQPPFTTALPMVASPNQQKRPRYLPRENSRKSESSKIALCSQNPPGNVIYSACSDTEPASPTEPPEIPASYTAHC